MAERKTLKSVSIDDVKPRVTLTPIVEVSGETCRIHHIKSDSIAVDGRDTFVPLRHVSKQKRRIFELEDENAKLRESVRNLLLCIKHEECGESCPNYEPMYTDYGYEKNGSTVVGSEYLGCCAVGLENCNSMFFDTDEYLRELGIEVES